MQLVAYGAQDAYLTGNPMITFFKVVYRRHTNFAIEAIENTFSGSADFSKRVQCQVVRNGDLISKVYLKVTLAGANTTPPALLNGVANPAVKTWAWVSKIGHTIIKNVELTIGGTQIDKQCGDWLNIWYELARNFAHDRGYDKMIGNNSDMVTLAHSRADTTIYVPLQFFFNRNEGLALPLIALQYHDVRINFEFRGLNECLVHSADLNIATDLSGLKFLDASLFVDYIFLDTEERKRFAQTSHEYLIEQVQFTGDESVSQTNQKFKLNFNHPTKALYWGVRYGKYTSGRPYLAYDIQNQDDMRLLATRRFALRCCEYTSAVVSGVTVYSLATSSNNSLVLNPAISTTSVEGLLFAAINPSFLVSSVLDVDNITIFGRQLIDSELSIPCDDFFKKYNLVVPFTSQGSPLYDVVVRQWDNYAINLNKTKNPLVQGNIQLNGHDRYVIRDGNYHNYVQPWQHQTNTPSDGINMYSFGLRPEQHQPSGSCNMSRIDNATLALTFDPSVSSGDNKISVYALNYNVLRIQSGMGGLAYAN